MDHRRRQRSFYSSTLYEKNQKVVKEDEKKMEKRINDEKSVDLLTLNLPIRVHLPVASSGGETK